MSAPVSPSQPKNPDAPVTILRGWAKAYRDSPEHRFPSDPHAEFFPVDMEAAADRIEELEAKTALVTFNEACKRIEELEAALRFIADGYDNHDINHVDYRVKVYQVALDVLGEARAEK